MSGPVFAPHELGRRGEYLAVRHLEAAGWLVLARNYRFGRREVDLVVSRSGLTVFVEVKTRAGSGFGHPAESVTARKRREIEIVARDFIFHHGDPGVGVRFDVVSVEVGAGGRAVRIEHFEDAWRPGWP